MMNSSDLFAFCAICDEILTDPVTLPCVHELCLECYRNSIASANFTCPLCRKRVSTWARKNSSDPVNRERKDELDKLYASFGSIEDIKLAVRLQKEEDCRVMSKRDDAGELMKEYVKESKLVQEERQHEEELSMEVVKKYQEEMVEIQKRELAQIIDDEIFAKRLHEAELLNSGKSFRSDDGCNKTDALPKLPKKKVQKLDATSVMNRPHKKNSLVKPTANPTNGVPKLTKWFSPM